MSAERTAALRLAQFRAQSVIGRGVQCNADLIEQVRHGLSVPGIAIVGNCLGLPDERAPRACFAAVQHQDERENCVSVYCGFPGAAARTFSNRIEHGGSLSLLPAQKPIRAALAAHRLCEGSK